MLYGESMIDLEKLKKWVIELKPESIPNTDSTWHDLLTIQLNAFQEMIKKLPLGTDWRAAEGAISEAFMKVFLKTENNAIRIANYYECFLLPADQKTKKHIIKGYPGYEQEYGSIDLYNGKDKIGTIGQKSDLMWKTFFEYFIVEGEYGDIFHTLANHEEIVSLQLWNVDGMGNKELRDYVNQVLTKVAMQSGLLFRKIQPEVLWKEEGECGQYKIDVSGSRLESIPLAYFDYGITSSDPRVAFLHLYQTMEYFFLRAKYRATINGLQNAGIGLETGSKFNGDIDTILRDYTRRSAEKDMLKIVIGESISPSEIIEFIKKSRENIDYYTRGTSENIRIPIDIEDDKVIPRLSERIYSFRCAIVHAKGESEKQLITPDDCDETVMKELPLLKMVAYKVLCAWSL